MAVRLTITNLKDLVNLAEELNIELEGKNEATLIEEVEAAMFGGAQSTVVVTSEKPKTSKQNDAAKQALIDAVLAKDDIKAEKIRSLLLIGVPKGKIAELLDVRYQQVYQVEQRQKKEV